MSRKILIVGEHPANQSGFGRLVNYMSDALVKSGNFDEVTALGVTPRRTSPYIRDTKYVVIDSSRFVEGVDQKDNVFRLFFNRVVAVLNALLTTDDGGKFIYMPRGLFYSTTAQTAAATNTGYPVEFENTYIGNVGL